MEPSDLGKFLIHLDGEGHDHRFETLEAARAAAVDEKDGHDIPVLILQIVEIA